MPQVACQLAGRRIAPRRLLGQAAHRHPRHLQPEAGPPGDVVPAPVDQPDQRGTHVPAAQQPDTHGFRSHDGPCYGRFGPGH